MMRISIYHHRKRYPGDWEYWVVWPTQRPELAGYGRSKIEALSELYELLEVLNEERVAA